MSRNRSNSRLAGLALFGAAALGFAGFTSYAVKADAARGLTVADSLCTVGIGCTYAEQAAVRAYLKAQPKSEPQRFAAELRGRLHYAPERPAVPARLIGRCNGRLMAAMEESAFPAGCAWIEPIREASAS